MQQQTCEAVFTEGILRPLTDLQLEEGQAVTLIIESETVATSPKKGFPAGGLIDKLTIAPLQIPDFYPLSREEANER
jgi:predicted DNA-binding antitoxin AbrB/MazE fold protein